MNEVQVERPARMGAPFRPIGPEAWARVAQAEALDVAAIRRDRPGALIEP